METKPFRFLALCQLVVLAAACWLNSSRAGAQTIPSVGVVVGIDDVVDPVVDGAPLVYRLQVTNPTQTAIPGVTIRTATPDGATFRSATAPNATVTAPTPGERGPITIVLPSLDAGARFTVDLAFFMASEHGPEFRLDATIEANDRTIDVQELTFVAALGDAILTWDPPGIYAGGVVPPLMGAYVERVKAGPIFGQTGGFVETVRLGQTYNVYRADGPNVTPSSATLVASFPSTQRNTGPLSAYGPGFFAVTVRVDDVETAPTRAVSFGKGEPVVESSLVVKGKLVAVGTSFEPGVRVTVDGIAFSSPAKVSADGTRVTQGGKLATGSSLKRYLKTHGLAAVCFENPSGGVACDRVGPLFESR